MLDLLPYFKTSQDSYILNHKDITQKNSVFLGHDKRTRRNTRPNYSILTFTRHFERVDLCYIKLQRKYYHHSESSKTGVVHEAEKSHIERKTS